MSRLLVAVISLRRQEACWRVALAVFAVTASPAASFAEESDTLVVSLSKSGVSTMTTQAPACLVAHEISDDVETETLKVMNRGRTLRIDRATGPDAPLTYLSFSNGDTTYGSMHRGGEIEAQAEAQFDSLSDDEYYDMLDRAEALADQNHPAFDNLVMTIDGAPLRDYANAVRAAERFPASRRVSIQIGLAGVPVMSNDGSNTIEQLGVSYSGPCTLAIMLE